MSIKSSVTLPFKIGFDTNVSGGYAANLHNKFYKKTQITNYHEDDVNHDENDGEFAVSLQSPITNEWVGGRSHRHVPVNDGALEKYIGRVLTRWDENFEKMQNLEPVTNISYIRSNEYSVVKTGSIDQFKNKKAMVFDSLSSENRILELTQSFIGPVTIDLSIIVNRDFYDYGLRSFSEPFVEWFDGYTYELDYLDSFENNWNDGGYLYEQHFEDSFETGWTNGEYIYADSPDLLESFETGWTNGEYIYADSPDLLESFETGWITGEYIYAASPNLLESFETGWTEVEAEYPDSPDFAEPFDSGWEEIGLFFSSIEYENFESW